MWELVEIMTGVEIVKLMTAEEYFKTIELGKNVYVFDNYNVTLCFIEGTWMARFDDKNSHYGIVSLREIEKLVEMLNEESGRND